MLAVLVMVGLPPTGCGEGERAQTFAEEAISFRYPKGWHVVGFSSSNSPPRLAVASYSLPANAVEGDCGGREAVELRPGDGALVLLIDNGRKGSYPLRPRHVTLSAGDFANYECFGPSTMFRFSVHGRDFQAHVSLGARASAQTRRRALAVLDTLTAR